MHVVWNIFIIFLNICRHYFHIFNKTVQHFWAHMLHILRTFRIICKGERFIFSNTFLQDTAAFLHSMCVVTKLILDYYTLTNLPSDRASAYTITQNVYKFFNLQFVFETYGLSTVSVVATPCFICVRYLKYTIFV